MLFSNQFFLADKRWYISFHISKCGSSSSFFLMREKETALWPSIV